MFAEAHEFQKSIDDQEIVNALDKYDFWTEFLQNTYPGSPVEIGIIISFTQERTYVNETGVHLKRSLKADLCLVASRPMENFEIQDPYVVATDVNNKRYFDAEKYDHIRSFALAEKFPFDKVGELVCIK